MNFSFFKEIAIFSLLFLTACAANQAVDQNYGQGYPGKGFGEPQKIAPDYYYRTNPTYPTYPSDNWQASNGYHAPYLEEGPSENYERYYQDNYYNPDSSKINYEKDDPQSPY